MKFSGWLRLIIMVWLVLLVGWFGSLKMWFRLMMGSILLCRLVRFRRVCGVSGMCIIFGMWMIFCIGVMFMLNILLFIVKVMNWCSLVLLVVGGGRLLLVVLV